jgi:hypothetical protein
VFEEEAVADVVVVGTRLGGPSLTCLVWCDEQQLPMMGAHGGDTEFDLIQLIPSVPTCSLQVPNGFPLQFPNMFPMFSMCSPRVFPIALGSNNVPGEGPVQRRLSDYLAHSQW